MKTLVCESDEVEGPADGKCHGKPRRTFVIVDPATRSGGTRIAVQSRSPHGPAS